MSAASPLARLPRCPALLAIAAFVAVMCVASGSLVAQGGVAQLGLTETAARNFVLDEIKSPASGRRSAIAIAGTRGFLMLPPAARGPAASALFAWAKTYVNSVPFKTAYATMRTDRIPQPKQYALSVEETVQKNLDEQLAGIEQLKKAAASMPAADAAKLLQNVKQQEAFLRSPEIIKSLRERMAAERTAEAGNETAIAKEVNEKYPPDPQKLFARRLREFLDGTQNVNFAAKTISLTGGADGIEFVEPADRKNSWVWQEAVIAGKEATTAARAAAEAWLKEIER
jgi:hypothetical protein